MQLAPADAGQAAEARERWSAGRKPPNTQQRCQDRTLGLSRVHETHRGPAREEQLSVQRRQGLWGRRELGQRHAQRQHRAPRLVLALQALPQRSAQADNYRSRTERSAGVRVVWRTAPKPAGAYTCAVRPVSAARRTLVQTAACSPQSQARQGCWHCHAPPYSSAWYVMLSSFTKLEARKGRAGRTHRRYR